MKDILSKVKLGTQPGGRPPVAVEITPDGVLAAALPASGQPAAYAYHPLPAGALQPGIGEPNVRAPEAVSAAIRAALDQLSPSNRAVTLIIPDTVVRVFVLDFDTLPAKPVEVFPVLRFRLRKMIPFDVEHAGISYQVLVEKKDEVKVLAAVMPGAILAEYEGAVRAAGYEPGAVLPSSLAALEAIDSMEAVLIVNLGPASLTTTITNGQDLLLYRTIDLPADAFHRRDEVRRGVAVAAAYYEDKLGAPPTKLYFAGVTDTEDAGAVGFAQWLDGFELTILDVAPRPATGAMTALGNASIAGVAGALAGVK